MYGIPAHGRLQSTHCYSIIAYVEWSEHLGQIAKNPPKKIRSVKLTEHACHCNDLISSACNERKRISSKFAETCLEKFVKSNQFSLFLAGF